MLDDDETVELRELRARVFGADADADAAVLARWEELEARQAGSGSAASSRASDPGPALSTPPAPPVPPTRPPVPTVSAEVAAAAFDSPSSSRLSDPVPARPRRRALLLAGAVAGAALALTGAYFAGASGVVHTPQAAASSSPSSHTGDGMGGALVDAGTGKAVGGDVAQVPIDETTVHGLLEESYGPVTLTLVARLDRMNLWWAKSTDGKSTCIALQGEGTLSTACDAADLTRNGMGIGTQDESGRDIAYWVTPDKEPYVEVAPDLQTLMDEHPQPTPQATP